MISTIIGGGIVGIPFSLLHAGIPFGMFLNMVIAISASLSCKLYVGAKDLMTVPVESLFEIGFLLWGRKSIYIISVIIWLASTGLMMIYFIVFGDISRSIVKQLFYDSTTSNALTHRWLYVLILGLCLLPLVIMKHLKELKIISITLFVAIGLFILLFIVQIIQYGLSENKDTDYGKYW